jgi:hypothetical protein
VQGKKQEACHVKSIIDLELVTFVKEPNTSKVFMIDYAQRLGPIYVYTRDRFDFIKSTNAKVIFNNLICNWHTNLGLKVMWTFKKEGEESYYVTPS